VLWSVGTGVQRDRERDGSRSGRLCYASALALMDGKRKRLGPISWTTDGENVF
jgi:hypothetical protein